MNEERLILALEKIATALAGLDETAKRAGRQFWPEARPVREAIASRVETEEDRIRRDQGASDKPIEQWLSELGDPEEEQYIGERSRKFIEEQRRNASSKDSTK